MKKIAVFGKPGGGKSTLSKKLSTITGIKLCPLDLIEYQKNGERISLDKYTALHEELIKGESWIIEGFGSIDSFWSRVDAADTLIYVDLPYRIHYWWVLKRLLFSPFIKPEGWPDGSSVIKGSLNGWKYLRLSPKFWTADFYKKLKEVSGGKQVYRISSVAELNQFANACARSL